MFVKNLIILLFSFSFILSPAYKSEEDQAYYHYYKGKSARQKGKPTNAIRHYQKAVKQEPGSSLYILALIQIYLETGDFQKAQKCLDEYRQVFAKKDDVFVWYFIKGLAYACNGEHNLAYHKFKHAEKLSKKLSDTDSSLLSHLYNNLACERILYQPVEWTPYLEDAPHLTISDKVLPEAWSYYDRALDYDPDNEIAAGNQKFVEKFCDCLKQQPPKTNDFTIKLDQTPVGPPKYSTENKYKLPIFGLRFLPDRISQITRIMNEYNEVVLLLDVSGSMEEEIIVNNIQGTRFDVMKDISKYLVSKIDPGIAIGAISVGSDCEDWPEITVAVDASSNRRNLFYKIDYLQTDGSTPLNDRLSYCEQLFSDSTNKKAILLLTDGINTCGEANTCDIAAGLFNQGINIYILSFLLENDSEMEYSVYDCMANITGGQIYEVEGKQGIGNKTLIVDPPYYSLVLPQQKIDTSTCLHHNRLKCTLPCNPTFMKAE